MKILLISWFFPPTIGGIPSLLETLLKTWQKYDDMFFYILTKVPYDYTQILSPKVERRRKGEQWRHLRKEEISSEYGYIPEQIKKGKRSIDL